MKRFASIFPFLEHGSSSLHIGRLVANHDFVRALLRFGTFDEYVFSGPSVANLRDFEAVVDGWELDPARRRAVRCCDYLSFARVLASEPIHAAHVGGWGYFMPGLHDLRRHAVAPFPITGMTFSLHGREMVDHAVRLAHAGMTEADAVFCISRDGREVMRRLLDGGRQITGRSWRGQLLHLPLGVDDSVFDDRGDRQRGRQRLRIADDAVVLLTLGRISPTQKMDLGPWLRTLARHVLPGTPVPVVAVLAGGASVGDLALVRQVVDAEGLGVHVRLAANFPVAHKADLLAAADVLVMPTDNTQETFGLSLIEAQAARLPVVASDYDGYKDIVRDGIDGFRIPTTGLASDPLAAWFDVMDPNVAQLFQSQAVAIDLEALAARVNELVRDAERRRAMGGAGRSRAEEQFRFSRVIARYEETWDELAAVAAALEPTPVAPSAWNLDPVTVFGHYPTRTLSPDDVVEATVVAPDIGPFSDVAAMITRDAVAWVLSRTQNGSTVATLRAHLPGDAPAPAPTPAAVADATILWLAKYGMVRIRPAVATRA